MNEIESFDHERADRAWYRDSDDPLQMPECLKFGNRYLVQFTPRQSPAEYDNEDDALAALRDADEGNYEPIGIEHWPEQEIV